MHLLIVDDSSVNLDLLQAQLEADGHDAVPAANGIMALDALEHDSFDGVISDILMPEMDGFRLCYEIRRSERLKSLPVVLCTASYTSPSDRALAMDLGADAYIAKPAAVVELIAALKTARQVTGATRHQTLPPPGRDALERYSTALVRRLGQANVALNDANEDLRDLFENSHDLLQSLAPDGRFLYANRACFELLGYDEPEFRELHIVDLIPAASRSRVERLFDRLGNGESVREFELQLRSKSGDYVPVEGSATPRIVDGKLVSIRCSWRNVTERQNAEAARQHLAAIVSHSTDAIVGRNLEGIVTSWNAGAERIFGYTADEMVGAPIDRLIPDDRKDEERNIVARLARGEHIDHFETVRLRKDGRRIDVSLTISPIMDAAGNMIGASKIARDVTLHKAADAAHRASDERLAALVETSMDAIITVDRAQKIRQFNPAAEHMFGIAEVDAIGAPLASLLPAKYRAIHRDHIEAFGRTGVTVRRMGSPIALTGLRRDGSEFPVEVTISQMDMADGHYYTAILRDITERRNHEVRIARLARVQAVLSGINAAIVRIRDPQVLFNEACRIASEEGGFGIAWIGRYDKATGDIVPVASRGLDGAHAEAMASARNDVAEGQGLVGLAVRSRSPQFVNDLSKDSAAGGPRRLTAIAHGLLSEIALPLVVDDEAVGVMVLFAAGPDFFSDDEVPLLVELAGDVSFALTYMAREKQASYLAYFDALTGLPNRTLFVDRIAQALKTAAQTGGRVAVVIGDIDRFGQINEALGRHGGDALLRKIAARVASVSPQPDNTARIVADEFATLITDAKSPGEVAERFAGTLNAVSMTQFEHDGRDVHITMTGGIALSPQGGDTAELLLGNAHLALEKAKRTGERYLIYQPEMTQFMSAALTLENKLRRALALHQFEIHYQPELDARTGKVTGLEALLRWNDPDVGIVAPIHFIPVLEATGMIVEVGEWVIRRALMQIREWTAAGVDSPCIAINVSPRQLQDRNFIESVRQMLADHAADPGALDFEITEGMVMSDSEAAVEKLEAIRRLGVGIAIDDFGTGYSSLSYLVRLPVTALKIDRTFVSGMTEGAHGLAIVTTIITLAHALNLKVIAEGVETEDQAKYLRLLKCDQLQGYLFSEPLPPEQIREFMLGHAAST